EAGQHQAAALPRANPAAGTPGTHPQDADGRGRSHCRYEWGRTMSDELPQCAREMEVTATIVDGRWDDDACADVRAHARTCAACREVAEVALALTPANGGEEIVLPAAGQVLWRARVRARAHAARRAA